MRRYASSLGATFREVDKRIKNKFKKDVRAYNYARKTSLEQNIKRFLSRASVLGSITPTNILVN